MDQVRRTGVFIQERNRLPARARSHVDARQLPQRISAADGDGNVSQHFGTQFLLRRYDGRNRATLSRRWRNRDRADFVVTDGGLGIGRQSSSDGWIVLREQPHIFFGRALHADLPRIFAERDLRFRGLHFGRRRKRRDAGRFVNRDGTNRAQLPRELTKRDGRVGRDFGQGRGLQIVLGQASAQLAHALGKRNF